MATLMALVVYDEGRAALARLVVAVFVCFVVFSPVLFLAFLAVLRWRSQRRDERRGRARDARKCWGCGYDLRHSPRTCPECGREVGF